MFKTYLKDVWFSEKIFYKNFRSLVETKIYNFAFTICWLSVTVALDICRLNFPLFVFLIL